MSERGGGLRAPRCAACFFQPTVPACLNAIRLPPFPFLVARLENQRQGHRCLPGQALHRQGQGRVLLQAGQRRCAIIAPLQPTRQWVRQRASGEKVEQGGFYWHAHTLARAEALLRLECISAFARDLNAQYTAAMKCCLKGWAGEVWRCSGLDLSQSLVPAQALALPALVLQGPPVTAPRLRQGCLLRIPAKFLPVGSSSSS